MPSPPVRVKICGIRTPEEALLAARLGADAVGVLVGQRHPSADFVTAAMGARILAALPPFVSGVLVSHCEEPAELLPLIAQVRPAAVQLHSPIPTEAVRQLRCALPGLRLLKAVHIPLRPPPPPAVDPLAELLPYLPLLDGVVADSCNPATGQVGGTGLRHDWSVTADLARRLPRPLLLAGGLTPATVAGAIRHVQPWGVDVNSGVRGADGGKDPALLERFIREAREASAAAAP